MNWGIILIVCLLLLCAVVWWFWSDIENFVVEAQGYQDAINNAFGINQGS